MNNAATNRTMAAAADTQAPPPLERGDFRAWPAGSAVERPHRKQIRAFAAISVPQCLHVTD
jgi:hypothetical protein